MLRQQGRRLVAAAGGGGGAGNAERCCAGGGAGGGEWAEDGGTPALEAVVGTGGAGDCRSGWCSESEVKHLFWLAYLACCAPIRNVCVFGAVESLGADRVGSSGNLSRMPFV